VPQDYLKEHKEVKVLKERMEPKELKAQHKEPWDQQDT
jgi:hypothetical protein